ncbi:MAG: PepSY-like domain-containing protein [Bacteroidetes bacterium]|nr:PepSY-like domain-containing protein [Bacteroidota bacterium]
MRLKSSIGISLLILFSIAGFSQVREIPKPVMETFSNQYPKAENADFKDQLVKVYVNFEMDGEKYIATYNNKGIWKGTEKEWDFDKLSDDVKEGFNKSKYADREVEETAVLYLPGGGEQYRLKVKKNDVEKKYLFFNKGGRLLRESVTL